MSPERIAMPKTARSWFEELSGDRQNAFLRTTRARVRYQLFPQHWHLTDDYYHDAILRWWEAQTLLESFKPALVVMTAHWLYLNDAEAGRLQVENYDERMEHAEASEPPLYESTISLEKALHDKLVVETIKKYYHLSMFGYSRPPSRIGHFVAVSSTTRNWQKSWPSTTSKIFATLSNVFGRS
jgi:hypothetical protein